MEKEKNDRLLQENKELREMQTTVKHNERGAGRKRTITDEQLEKFHELHKQGLSYGAIAKQVGFSKACVYKLIKKQSE